MLQVNLTGVQNRSMSMGERANQWQGHVLSAGLAYRGSQPGIFACLSLSVMMHRLLLSSIVLNKGKTSTQYCQ